MKNLIEDLIKKSIENKYFTEINIYSLSENIKKIFDDEKIGGLLTKWFQEEFDKSGYSITNGIFYIHSYLIKGRIPYYFGDYYQDKDIIAREETVNHNIWRVDYDINQKRTKYYHILNALASEFEEQYYFVINYSPNIEIGDVTIDGKIILMTLPYNGEYLDEFRFLIDNSEISQKWEEKCEELVRMYKEKSGNFSSIDNISHNKWKNLFSEKLIDPVLMFTNIYRYAINLKNKDDQIKQWPLVIYIPGAIYYKYRAGLVCNLNPSDNKISFKKIIKVADNISNKLSFLSNFIHATEISLYDRKMLLPMNIGGRPYQEYWLTKISTAIMSDNKSKNIERKDMFDKMFAIRRKHQKNKIGKVYTEVYNTLIQLTAPDQRVYSSYDSIVSRIIETVIELTKILFGKRDCDIKNCPFIDLLERLTKTEGDLRFISAYREHFIHSFHVFYLGLMFLQEHFNSKSISINIVNKKIQIHRIDILRVWFFTSLYHDTAYAVQKIEFLAENYYKNILLNNSSSKLNNKSELKPFRLDKSKLLIDNPLHNFLLHFDELNEISNTITRALVDKADHGILSAFIFHNMISDIKRKENNACSNCLSNIWNESEEIKIHNICKAICLHHCYDKHWIFENSLIDPKTNLKTTLINQEDLGNALLMLLILCDSIAQAGRTFENNNSNIPEYELRIGNIIAPDIGNKDPFIIDLVYSPYNKDGTVEELRKKLMEEGQLILNDKDNGGWYEKPKRVISKWKPLTQNDRKVVLRLYVAEYFPDGKYPYLVNWMPLTHKNGDRFTNEYEFPLPI